MAVSYTSTARGSSGTWTSNTMYRDVVVSSATAGDLLVGVGVCEWGNASGTGSCSTQSGSTSSWTTVYQGGTASHVGFVMAYATVTSTGSVTVRVAAPSNNSSVHYGCAVWRVPAADWDSGGSLVPVSVPAGDADAKSSVTLSTSSIVLYGMGNWDLADPTSYTPASPTLDEEWFQTGGQGYGAVQVHWTGQASGTRSYGANGISSGVVGGILGVPEASSSTQLVVASLDHSVAVEGPLSLTQAHTLTVAAVDLAVALDGPLSLQAAIALAVAPLNVAVALDGVALSVTHVLAVADMLLPVTMSQEGLPLTQTHNVAVEPLDHTVALDQVTLTPAGQLDVASLDLAVTVDQVALTQAHTLTVAAVDHTVALEGPLTLTEHTAGSLVVQPLDLAVTIDQVALTQAHTLTVAALDHTVTLDGPLTITVQAVQLTVAGIDHTVTLDGVALSVTHVLVVQSLLLAVLLDSAESVSWSLWVGGVEVSCTLQGVYDGSVVQPYTTVEVVS